MVKSSTTPKAGLRTDPEAIERRRMQNRLAQRKRRLKRAQMAREEKEKQQRLQAAQAASRLTFMNEAYHLPMGQRPLYHEPQFHPAMNGYYTSTPPHYTSTPPPFEDIFTHSPYMPPTPMAPMEAEAPYLLNEYPSPSVSRYGSATPPLSVYSLDDDLPHSISGGDLDPTMLLGTSVDSAPTPRKGHNAMDAFGLMPLGPLSPSRLQPDSRHRSSSMPTSALPTPFTPPRSVPSISSPSPSHTFQNRAISTTPTMTHAHIPHKNDNHNHTNCCCNSHNGLNMSVPVTSQPVTSQPVTSQPNPSHASALTHGKTGLHVCAEQGNTHVVQQLLGYGADIDSVDEYGRTALHYAISNNQAEVVKQLIERGASTTIADVNGISPMHLAAESGSKEIMQLMMTMMVATPSPQLGNPTSNPMVTTSAMPTSTATLPSMMIPGQDVNLQAGLIPSA